MVKEATTMGLGRMIMLLKPFSPHSATMEPRWNRKL